MLIKENNYGTNFIASTIVIGLLFDAVVFKNIYGTSKPFSSPLGSSS
jgi:hypothetical protein